MEHHIFITKLKNQRPRLFSVVIEKSFDLALSSTPFSLRWFELFIFFQPTIFPCFWFTYKIHPNLTKLYVLYRFSTHVTIFHGVSSFCLAWYGLCHHFSVLIVRRDWFDWFAGVLCLNHVDQLIHLFCDKIIIFPCFFPDYLLLIASYS